MNSNNRSFVQVSPSKHFFDAGEEQNPNEKRPKFRVYFIGFKLLDKNGNPPAILVKQKPLQMPPIGGHIMLDQVYYDDLRLRTQMWNPETLQFVDAVTTDPEIAAAVKSAFESGRITKDSDVQSFTKLVTDTALSSMSVEELQAELERRKGLVEATDETPESDDDAKEDSTEEPEEKPKRRGRPPKKS